jgi:undecaprenyl-diphosphatase
VIALRRLRARPLLSRKWRRRIIAFDNRVDTAFNRLRQDRRANRVFYVASELGDFSLVWHLIGAGRGLLSERQAKAAVRLMAVLAVESLVVNQGVKSFFRRERPVPEFERPHRLRVPRTTSFPSGHASAAFTAAGVLADRDPLGPLYYAMAALVASSRIHVKIHHASDVLGGVAVGLVVGQVARRVWPLEPARSG